MKQVIVLSLALSAALVGSYLTWTDDSEEIDEGRTAVYPASGAELERIAWKTETRDVSVTKRSDERGEYYWIDSTERVVPKVLEDTPEPTDGEEPVDGEEPTDGEPLTPETDVSAEPTETTTSFLGSADAAGLWAAYAPLMALRELPTDGSVPDATFGLAEPTGTIEVTRRGQPLVLTIGGETYGRKDRYVRHDGHTYLVDDGDLRPLQFATTRLVERSLYPQAEADIEQITVRYNGTTDTFVQRNRDDKTKAYWAREARPEEQDDAAETWIGKLLKLKLRSYVDGSTVGPLEPVFSFEVTGGESWPVEVFRSTTDEKLFYAKGPFNRSMVELTSSIAKNIVDDLPEVMVTE
jgi:hypothetical protein